MTLQHIATSLLALSTAVSSPLILAQVEGPQPTQALVTVTSKVPTPVTPADFTVDLNGKSTEVTAVTPLAPAQTQIAILIDDGASELGRTAA